MTSEEINSQPERVRRYIHDLETMADPQGIILENWRLTEENACLCLKVQELKLDLEGK